MDEESLPFQFVEYEKEPTIMTEKDKRKALPIEQKLLFKHFATLVKILSIMRLRFTKQDSWFTTIVNTTITTIMILIGIYHSGFMLWLSMTSTSSDMSTSLVFVSWQVQSTLSMAFVIYWQRAPGALTYLRTLSSAQNEAGLQAGLHVLRYTRRKFYISLCASIFCVVYSNLRIFLQGDVKSLGIDDKYMNIYYFPILRNFDLFLLNYLLISWNVSFFIFTVLTDAAYLEMKYFNSRLSRLNGSDSDMKDELLLLLQVYAELTTAIRQLDKTFRIYAFAMIAIILPSFVLILLMLYSRTVHIRDFLEGVPMLLFCIYAFLCLTTSPARLHDEVSRSRTCLCLNSDIWLPYRPDVFQIATTLSVHLEQYDLGISIWGFAIVSRSLILATFSVVTMILSLLLEFTSNAKQIPIENSSNNAQ